MTKIKLCGLSRPEDIEAANELHPDYIGFVFAPKSRRRVTAAKARAILHGRHHATTADVSAVALPVLRHRVITTFAAEAAGVTSDDIVGMLLKELKPDAGLDI